MVELDWNLVKSFVAVAETGSLSAAARRLGASQPTIGRHVAELEATLRLVLFQRGRRGYLLTGDGAKLLEDARRMQAHADTIQRLAVGHSRQLEGTVRITASEVIGALVLPKIIAALRREVPGIQVEVVASDRVDNLLRRDADIAIRMVRPDQLDLVTRHVADIPLVACAASDYVERHGRPVQKEDLLDHDVLGMDRNGVMIDGFAAMGVPVTRDFFALRSDSSMVLWEAVKAGAGIGFAQMPLVRQTPGLVAFLEDLALPALPVWLTMHADLQQNPRMRFVNDYLFRALRAYAQG